VIEPIELRGRFVWLRPLSSADLEPMQRLVSGPRETFTWGNVPQPDLVEAYVSRAIAAMERREAVVFATCAAGSGELIGCTRLFDLDRWEWPAGADPRAGQDVLDAAEIGYTWIAPAWQRTAVNTEAKLLMLQHAFETWRCWRVTLKTDERNDRSRRAIERLGAHFDGVLRAFQPAVDGRPRNTAYFTILAGEWPRVKEGLKSRLTRSV